MIRQPTYQLIRKGSKYYASLNAILNTIYLTGSKKHQLPGTHGTTDVYNLIKIIIRPEKLLSVYAINTQQLKGKLTNPLF